MPRKAKTLKRADHEGTISKRLDANGKTIGYKGAVRVGFKTDGTEDRRWVSGKTEASVREKMETIKNARNTGMVSGDAKLTLAEYLTKWLAFKDSDGTKPKTHAEYSRLVNRRIVPVLGKFKLEKLRPLDVQNALTSIKTSSTIIEARRARGILSLALNQAVRWEILPRNVCLAVRAPALPDDGDSDVRFWTPEEVGRFLGIAQSHRHYAVFYVALMTGMRSGELLGLRWVDVDTAASLVSVAQSAVVVNGNMTIGTPKSKASRRKISVSPDTLVILEQHRERQAKERHNAQEGWANMDLVFASEVGTVTNYANLRTVFKQLQARVIVQGWKDAELIDQASSLTTDTVARLLLENPDLKKKMAVSDLNLHGLRHTHASVLIRRNISPKVVSDRLGHTSIGFTLKTYAHLFDDQKREAAIGIDAFLGITPSSVPVVVSSGVPTALN
jgi:integrase